MDLVQNRAYSKEQKEQRSLDILVAARELFENRRYEEVTMLDIAHHCGVSKGTLYVYYKTKEALFLSYAKSEIDHFFGRLFTSLNSQSESAGVAGVVNALGSAYGESKALIRLLSILHSVLESNVDFDTALAFRQSLLPFLEQTGEECERLLAFLKPGHGQKLLLTFHAIALGFQLLANPSSVIKDVEKQEGMDIYSFDFESSFLTTIETFLIGMEVRAKR